MINPVNRTRRASDVLRYRLEPYVMAGDVYSRAPHAGRGGWSWYTGSSGWMYRVGLEHILGVRRRADRIEIDPCIPASWPEFQVRWRHGTTDVRITVLNPSSQPRRLGRVAGRCGCIGVSPTPLGRRRRRASSGDLGERTG
jgi:cyclic beta-1,2-glucan synthetase